MEHGARRWSSLSWKSKYFDQVQALTVMSCVTSVLPLREEPFNLGRATSAPNPSLHSSVGAEGGPRSRFLTRAKPSSLILVLDLDVCLDLSSESLRNLTSRYNTYIFTSEREADASPQLDSLDPSGTMFSGCFFNHDLSYHDKMKCDVKDLRAAFSRKGIAYDPRKVVMVDTFEDYFARNPSNGIPFNEFEEDQEQSLICFLKRLERKDVRSKLEETFGLKFKFLKYDTLHEEVEDGDADDSGDEEKDDGSDISSIGDLDLDFYLEDGDAGDAGDAGDTDSDISSIGDLDDLDCSMEDDPEPETVEEVEEVEETEYVIQALRRSPRLQNLPRVDYRKYF